MRMRDGCFIGHSCVSRRRVHGIQIWESVAEESEEPTEKIILHIAPAFNNESITKMAPFPVRKLVSRTGKKCLKVLRKLSSPRNHNDGDNRTSDLPELPEVTTTTECIVSRSSSRDEDSKSCITTVTWLDDVRDLEDMENRLNEALELKMRTAELRRC
ncbi:hypothetical protein C0J52_18556 [Blattella germanica]|nr:hypothetical protein C0J52_18556 [Blattella germanica]